MQQLSVLHWLHVLRCYWCVCDGQRQWSVARVVPHRLVRQRFFVVPHVVFGLRIVWWVYVRELLRVVWSEQHVHWGYGFCPFKLFGVVSAVLLSICRAVLHLNRVLDLHQQPIWMHLVLFDWDVRCRFQQWAPCWNLLELCPLQLLLQLPQIQQFLHHLPQRGVQLYLL